MSDYKLTIVEKDYYTDVDKEKHETLIIKNVFVIIDGPDLVFRDTITGELIKALPRRKVLHMIKIDS